MTLAALEILIISQYFFTSGSFLKTVDVKLELTIGISKASGYLSDMSVTEGLPIKKLAKPGYGAPLENPP